MNKEIKIRLICFCIGVLILSTGYFLCGEWRDGPKGDGGGYTPGKPVFEFDVIKSNCVQEGNTTTCRIPISSNIVLGFVGAMFFLASICPIRWTDYASPKEVVK